MKNTAPNAQAVPHVTLDETVSRMQRETLHDVVAGHVPRTLRSFGDLHDFRDANCYGGFCEDKISDPLIAAFGGRTADEALPDGFSDYMNTAQSRVDTWLFNGALERESLPPGWRAAGELTKEEFDPWGWQSESPLYELNVRANGVPSLGLMVLQEDAKFIGVHGGVKMDPVDSAKEAAEQATHWGLENGWSDEVMRMAQWPETVQRSTEGLLTSDHSLLAGPAVIPEKGEFTQSHLKASSKPIRTDTVFGDAPEPEGGLWRNMATFENALANKLLARPGSVVAIGTDAWMLREVGDHQVLHHATLTEDGLTDEMSRFDFGLEWVDQDAGALEAHNSLLMRANDEFDQHVTSEAVVIDKAVFSQGSIDPNGPKDCASEGRYNGAVVEVKEGVVTQRINRAGDTVRHDANKLNSVPVLGMVVDIQYRQGRGQVGAPGHDKGQGR